MPHPSITASRKSPAGAAVPSPPACARWTPLVLPLSAAPAAASEQPAAPPSVTLTACTPEGRVRKAKRHGITQIIAECQGTAPKFHRCSAVRCRAHQGKAGQQRAGQGSRYRPQRHSDPTRNDRTELPSHDQPSTSPTWQLTHLAAHPPSSSPT